MDAPSVAAQNLRKVPTATFEAKMKTVGISKVQPFTTAERDALANDDLFAGRLIFNSTTSKLNFYTGSAWEAVTSA